MENKYKFRCIDCGAEYDQETPIYLCPACEAENQPGSPPRGVLKTVFSYDRIRSAYPGKDLFANLAQDLFLPLLPLRGMESLTMLSVGGTPLYRFEGRTSGQADRRTGIHKPADSSPGREERLPAIYLKDDTRNPTCSFKDRASALVAAWAKEHGIGTLVAASTGNAGSSLAGICASTGQKAIIVAPAAAPMAKLIQIMMYGAILVPVNGTYDDAFDLSVKLSGRYGWYNRNTAFNPLTIEGKKTVSFEIFSQLGRVPDRLFIPVGDGVIYSGVMKGFEDLMMLGITDRMPVAVAVQAAGSPNVANNLNSQEFISVPSRTIADSISVDIPRCFRMTRQFMQRYHGEAITVTDEEILRASSVLAAGAGIFAEPAASAAFAGLSLYRDKGLLRENSTNVVILTGNGLKDLAAVQPILRIPSPVDPDLDAASAYLEKMIQKSLA